MLKLAYVLHVHTNYATDTLLHEVPILDLSTFYFTRLTQVLKMFNVQETSIKQPTFRSHSLTSGKSYYTLQNLALVLQLAGVCLYCQIVLKFILEQIIQKKNKTKTFGAREVEIASRIQDTG